MDDATIGVALVEEILRITPDDVVDPPDADATQILGDRRLAARNDRLLRQAPHAVASAPAEAHAVL